MSVFDNVTEFTMMMAHNGSFHLSATSENVSNLSYHEASMDAEATNCPANVRFLLNTVAAGSVCLLGFLGNAMSYAVLSKDKEAPVAAFLLQTLAFVDNFFLGVWFLHFSLSDMFTYLQLHDRFHVSWLYIRVYTYPLLFVGQTGTIWMIVLIAVSRYVAVCKPYRAAEYSTKATLQRAVACILSVSVLYNVPRFFETKIGHHLHNGTTYYSIQRTSLGSTRIYGLLYFDSLYYIFSFVLPLVMLTFLNTSLTLAYRRVQRRRQSLRLSNGDDHNITLVMIIVILVFVLCNAPARIAQIVWGYLPQVCLSTQFILIELSNVLEVLNSSINFVIYCVFRSQFRHILRSRVCPGQTPTELVITECLRSGPRDSNVTSLLSASTALTSGLLQDTAQDKEQRL